MKFSNVRFGELCCQKILTLSSQREEVDEEKAAMALSTKFLNHLIADFVGARI
jgi:hypothetical protein